MPDRNAPVDRAYDFVQLTTTLRWCILCPLVGLMNVVVASGQDGTVEIAPRDMVRQLVAREWGKEFSRIEFIARYPQNADDARAVNVLEIDADRLRWVIERVDKAPSETEVYGVNREYAFRLHRTGTSDWQLRAFQRAGEEPSRLGIKETATKQLRSIRRIPYGLPFGDESADDLLERFAWTASQERGRITLLGIATDKPPRTAREAAQNRLGISIQSYRLVVDPGSFFVHSWTLRRKQIGWSQTGTIAFPNDDHRLYRYTSTESKPEQPTLDMILEITDVEIEKNLIDEAFYLSFYDLDEPNNKE